MYSFTTVNDYMSTWVHEYMYSFTVVNDYMSIYTHSIGNVAIELVIGYISAMNDGVDKLVVDWKLFITQSPNTNCRFWFTSHINTRHIWVVSYCDLFSVPMYILAVVIIKFINYKKRVKVKVILFWWKFQFFLWLLLFLAFSWESNSYF